MVLNSLAWLIWQRFTCLFRWKRSQNRAENGLNLARLYIEPKNMLLK